MRIRLQNILFQPSRPQVAELQSTERMTLLFCSFAWGTNWMVNVNTCVKEEKKKKKWDNSELLFAYFEISLKKNVSPGSRKNHL